LSVHGKDSVEPFLAFENKHTIMLALTSNEGAFDFQTLSVDGKNYTSTYWKHLKPGRIES
jgi:orotidine-5'-phosphate decarboxylase